jgi:hypothetical protein
VRREGFYFFLRFLCMIFIVVFSSVADSDPGSGAFLTPESGAFVTPGSGMGKKTGSGSGMNNPDHVSKSLETNFLG